MHTMKLDVMKLDTMRLGTTRTIVRMAAKMLAVAGVTMVATLGAACGAQADSTEPAQKPASAGVARAGAGAGRTSGAGRYATVNGLRMYYEVHGPASTPGGQPPLVLLHGALSGVETSFGPLVPALAKGRQVIAIEQQAHAHTGDIDRPLRIATMAADTIALLDQLKITQVDLLGYSMGAGIALDVTLQRPALVRKLVVVSLSYKVSGLHPGLLDGIAQLKPEMLAGSPFEKEYLGAAPDPKAFPALVEKVKEMDQHLKDWTDDQIRSIKQPTLLIIGDSDIVRPEHAVETFRLLGGGIMGDTPAGLPNSQLAVVPGASHISVMHKTDVLLSIVPAFLDAKVK